MATRLGEAGISGEVISRILNHSPRDVTSRHYNHAKMTSQMREALVLWAGIVCGAGAADAVANRGIAFDIPQIGNISPT
jgi:hypothetical protein